MKRFSIILLTCLSFISATGTQTLPTVGTKANIGQVDGLQIEALVQSPAAQKTPLQIVCLFEYTEGDIFTSPPALPKELNGMVHVDQALHGLITDLRKSNQFRGKYLETLLINPPAQTIPAQKLLLIGLGDRHDFKSEIMYMIGLTGMREALRLGIASYTHASDIKDAGISSDTSEVTKQVIQGALDGLRTQQFLVKKEASAPISVTKFTLLAGPAFFEDSQKGLKAGMQR